MAANHSWGKSSLAQLATADPRWRAWADEVLRRSPCDLQVTCGYRGREAQEAAVKAGASRAHFGQSPHNRYPSQAVDLLVLDGQGRPDWDDASTAGGARWAELGRIGIEVAREMNLPIEWGGTWAKFKDKPHFELQGWRDLPAVER